jgi:hypothetical protein
MAELRQSEQNEASVLGAAWKVRPCGAFVEAVTKLKRVIAGW